MREGSTVRGKGNAGKGRVIWRKGILAKSSFNLRGDAEWERDCYMDITGVCVCTCKGGERRGRNLWEGSKKKGA